MIRYVVAVILTVAIVAVAQGGIDYAASANSDRMVATGVADLEDAAVSLASNEEMPPSGVTGAQRFVTVDLPGRSLTETPVVHFKLRRIPDERMTAASYRIKGGPLETKVIDVPITNDTGGNVVTLGGTEDQNLVLTLDRTDDDRPIVKVVRESEHYEP